MTNWNVKREYPALINWRSYCRNGQIPSGMFVRRCAEALNHVATYRNKVVLQTASDTVNPISIASGTGDEVPFRFHAGHNADKLVLFASFYPADAADEDPYIYMKVTEVGTGTVNSDELHATSIVAVGTNQIRDQYGWIEYTLPTVDAAYEVIISSGSDTFQATGLCAYLTGSNPASDTDSGITAIDFGTGSQIQDSDLSDLLQQATNLWKHNAAQLISWVAPTRAWNSARTYATYENYLSDDSTTSVSANTIGFTTDTTYCNSASSTTVDCVFGVYAFRNSGGGSTANNKAKLVNSSGDVVEITGIDGTEQWHTANVSLTAGTDKLDLHMECNGTDTITILGVCLYMYET